MNQLVLFDAAPALPSTDVAAELLEELHRGWPEAGPWHRDHRLIVGRQVQIEISPRLFRGFSWGRRWALADDRMRLDTAVREARARSMRLADHLAERTPWPWEATGADTAIAAITPYVGLTASRWGGCVLCTLSTPTDGVTVRGLASTLDLGPTRLLRLTTNPKAAAALRAYKQDNP